MESAVVISYISVEQKGERKRKYWQGDRTKNPILFWPQTESNRARDSALPQAYAGFHGQRLLEVINKEMRKE